MQDNKFFTFLKNNIPSRYTSFSGLLLGAILFILIAFIAGFGTSWYMLEKGTSLTRNKFGAWHNWTNLGVIDSDPYTKAYIARSGRLPLNAGHTQYFKAKTDDEGSPLTSHCNYILQGAPIASDWWSIGLYDGNGQAIINKAEQYAFNSKNIARLENGGYIIQISPYARPDNWLPSGKAENMILLIRAYGVHVSEETKSGDVISASLPTIKKLECS